VAFSQGGGFVGTPGPEKIRVMSKDTSAASTLHKPTPITTATTKIVVISFFILPLPHFVFFLFATDHPQQVYPPEAD
jgi:hypothetical protein